MATIAEPLDSAPLAPVGPTAVAGYAERFVCRSSEPFVGRCRAASKQHALQVLDLATASPAPPAAAVALALRIALDQVGPYTIADLITADGITSIGCSDVQLMTRWSEVFSILALSATPAQATT